MKTYHNKKWNISLDYPGDWEIMMENAREGGWETVVGIIGKPSRSGRPLVTIRVLHQAVISFTPADGGPHAPWEPARTPEEYNETCKWNLRQVLSGLQFISEGVGTLAGMSSGTLLYSFESDTGGTIRETQINLFGTAVTYRLMCEVPKEQSESVEKYFHSVVANFKPFAGN